MFKDYLENIYIQIINEDEYLSNFVSKKNIIELL